MEEIAPGVHHWTARHPRIKVDVSSYYLSAERVLLDPMLPREGIDWLERFPPRAILLTNRHHLREAADFVEAFGCSVHASRPGMHEFDGVDVDVEPFDFGDELPGGIVAHEVDSICPDETALHVPARRALACADGVVRIGDDAAVGFVPDELMGDDAERIKAGLRDAYAQLSRLDFDHLLLAHGAPVVGRGKQALASVARD